MPNPKYYVGIKTDPFRRGTQAFLGKTDIAIYLVKAIIQHLTLILVELIQAPIHYAQPGTSH